jgi:hypothetical protein
MEDSAQTGLSLQRIVGGVNTGRIRAFGPISRRVMTRAAFRAEWLSGQYETPSRRGYALQSHRLATGGRGIKLPWPRPLRAA